MLARKIAQDQLNATLAQEAAQLETDIVCLNRYAVSCASGAVTTQDFERCMIGASAEAQAYAVKIREGTGSTQLFAEQQKKAQAQLKATANASKGASTAFKALSIAANMIAMWAITKGIELATKAIDNYVRRVEIAREKLQETTSEIESLQSELDGVGKKIDEILSKDEISLTDENTLKELRAENNELERRLKLLEAQKELEANDLNRKIESKYTKEWGNGRRGITPLNLTDAEIEKYRDEVQTEVNHGYAIQTVSRDVYAQIQIERAKELLALNRDLTDEEKAQYEEIKNYAINEGQALADLTDGYTAITDAEKEQKKIWEGLIEDFSVISSSTPGITISIDDRLKAKFAMGKEDSQAISDWINSLSEDEKKIVITCEIDEASLDDLQEYLESKIEYVEDNIAIEFDITTHKDSIDDFQSKLKTLGDALSSIRSGEFSESDFTDLVQEFNELDGQSENLEEAIISLINNALKELKETLGEGVSDDLLNSLQSITNKALGLSTSLHDAFSDIHDSWDILHDFKETMDKGFDSNVTDSLLQSVRKLSGELERLVAGYYSGVVSAEQLYEALTQHYENDLHNYSEALIKKNELNEDFYNAVGLASEEVTNQFMDNYDVDIKNCKTYNQAKIEIEKQTLNTIGIMWSKYYNAQSKAFTSEFEKLQKQASYGDTETAEMVEQIKEQVAAYEAAVDGLNNIIYDGIRSNFEGIGGKLSANSSGSGSSSKDFEETFDWIETAIDRIERSISNLDLKASSVYRSWSERNANLKAELLDVKKEMDIQASGYNKYMQQANSVGLSEEWASKVRNGQIDINSITDKTLAERIKEYQEWYRNMPLYLVTGGGILFNC